MNTKKVVFWTTLTCSIGLVFIWAANQRGNVTRTQSAPLPSATEEPLAGDSAPRLPVRPASIRKTSEEAAPAAGKNSLGEAAGGAIAVPGTFEQAVDGLVSPATSFAQKQTLWRQLIDSGKLDLAITELEQRAKANPASAEIPAALGQAYLQKAGTIKDLREQGILGLKADATFEAALNLDASNWDARFWRTTAMSYWPPQLGKQTEVIEQCLQLLVQQEAQAPQPQFAQTYVLLGEQYLKQGQEQYAQEIWKRGLSLFPGHETLTAKLTAER